MQTLSKSPLVVRTNLANYPVTHGIRSGQVTSPILHLDCCGPTSAHDGFKDMVRGNTYQAGELAIVTFLQARAAGKPWVMLPVTVLGRFQHHCIGYNQAMGVMHPRDLEGRKVGIRTYAQTTGLWVRGILQHHHGVDLDKITWMTVGEGHLSGFEDPPNCERLPQGASLADLMLSGELAAAIMGLDMPKDPRIVTLIPDPHAAAESWYAAEGVVPVNHVFAVHTDLAQNRPDVVQAMYDMLHSSRLLAPVATRLTHPIGMDGLRKTLGLAIDWAWEQKMIPRRMAVDELFDDTTANLLIPH